MRYFEFGILLGFLLLISGVACLPSVYSQSSNSSQIISSDIEKNKNVVVELTDAFNQRNLSAIDMLVAKDIKEHRPGAGQGVDATKGFLMALQTAFPDFKTNINEIIAEGDRVLVFTNTTGTHQGPFVFAPGIAPTGKVLSFQTADLYTISENGTIVEHQDVIEIMDMLQKMGAIQFVTNSSSSSSSSPPQPSPSPPPTQ
jgi:predicted ester cyclase